MQKLTVEVDLDLIHGQAEASEIIANLISELEIMQEQAADGKLNLGASGIVLSPLEDDELAGNWRID
jgi:hypothetical protein